MDISLQNDLQLLSSSVIDHASLSSLLRQHGCKSLNDKIAYMKKKGLLTSLKRGVYLYKGFNSSNLISREVIANNLLGPSYISLDYALSYYGLIPENVYEVTSVTTKRSKSFESDLGIFSYIHINPEIYSVGVNIISSGNVTFMIAAKEKALSDKILGMKGVSIRSRSAMKELLFDDFRIEVDEFYSLNHDIIKECCIISRSVRLQFLMKILKENG